MVSDRQRPIPEPVRRDVGEPDQQVAAVDQHSATDGAGRWPSWLQELVGALAILGGTVCLTSAATDLILGQVVQNTDARSAAVRFAFLVLALVVAAFGALLLTGGGEALVEVARHRTTSLENLEASDPRPPILFLRSFAADGHLAHQPGVSALERRRSHYELINLFLDRAGPMAIVAEPDEETLPGPAQSYASGPWRSYVRDRFDRAAAAVFWAHGDGSAIRWELETALATLPPERIALLVPNDPDGRARFERMWASLTGIGVPSLRHQPAALTRAAGALRRRFLDLRAGSGRGGGIYGAVTFDVDRSSRFHRRWDDPKLLQLMALPHRRMPRRPADLGWVLFPLRILAALSVIPFGFAVITGEWRRALDAMLLGGGLTVLQQFVVWQASFRRTRALAGFVRRSA